MIPVSGGYLSENPGSEEAPPDRRTSADGHVRVIFRKAVGKIWPWSIGALGVHAGQSPVSDATDLFVGRVAYDVNDKLRVGALLTDGDPSGQSNAQAAMEFLSIDSVRTHR